jgi:hypothetical protein
MVRVFALVEGGEIGLDLGDLTRRHTITARNPSHTPIWNHNFVCRRLTQALAGHSPQDGAHCDASFGTAAAHLGACIRFPGRANEEENFWLWRHPETSLQLPHLRSRLKIRHHASVTCRIAFGYQSIGTRYFDFDC